MLSDGSTTANIVAMAPEGADAADTATERACAGGGGVAFTEAAAAADGLVTLTLTGRIKQTPWHYIMNATPIHKHAHSTLSYPYTHIHNV